MAKKRVTRKSGKNRRRWLAVGIGLILVIYFGLVGDYNIYRLWKLHHQRQELRAEKEKKLAFQARLATESELLQSDSTYIEKVARERFNMARPAEKVYLIKQEEDN